MQPSDDLVAYSRDIIRSGSKSFAAAATLFEPKTRASAYLLYAWCRHCDDETDGQELGHGAQPLDPAERRRRVDALYEQTRAALAGEPVGHPVFRAFQAVGQTHGLPAAYAFDHLEGFRSDAEGVRMRTFDDLLLYCYQVAGAVGVMMAWIMGVRDEPTLDRACDLGLGFQLTNIARDVIEDAVLGRVYLPEAWLEEAGVPLQEVASLQHRQAVYRLALRLVRHAEAYYDSAHWGMARLPFRSAWAIGAARAVYREIGRKLQHAGPEAWNGRLSTSKAEKATLVLTGGVAAVRAVAIDRVRRPPERKGLWNRPVRTSGLN